MAVVKTADLDAPADGERVVLSLPSVEAALVKVRVGGTEAGAICWPPYELDITEYVTGGETEIEIELVTGLRNLLGPHHRSLGEPDNTWKTAFNYNVDGTVPWSERDGLWVDDWFVLKFGLGGTASVEYRRPS
jgi:hypothetical protein